MQNNIAPQRKCDSKEYLIKNRPSSQNQRGGKQLYQICDTIALDKLYCITDPGKNTSTGHFYAQIKERMIHMWSETLKNGKIR